MRTRHSKLILSNLLLYRALRPKAAYDGWHRSVLPAPTRNGTSRHPRGPSATKLLSLRPAVAFCLGLSFGGAGLLPAPAAPVIAPALSGSHLALQWLGSPGTLYEIQTRSNLSLGSWETISTTVPPATLSVWTNPAPLSGTRFYRLLAPGGECAAFEPPEKSPAEPCECGSCDSGPGGAPFIYLQSGEVRYSTVDLHIAGRGLDFVWARKYRSRVGPNTAQGNGWDFSYNIRIEPFGGHLLVYDGNTRQDLYLRQTDGSYAADQFFREGRFNSNGVFTLLFPDTGLWEFLPLNGAPAQGKIQRIADRNGNALTFSYDGTGRLVTVTDTLDRNITVSYNGGGFISAVTDFAGRQVSYAYYQSSDADGSAGDLKSATSPAVTGTPNGNDFPSGKTTTYTYSKGLPVEGMNHNLLTVTDPKGQTWLRNYYSRTLDPADLSFDRITQQTEGESNAVMILYYVRQTAVASNDYAVIKTIVNDAAGNVSEWFYDAGNRCVAHRAYTGRATPGVTTTESVNRPSGKLRQGDPPSFETSYEWNADSLLTRAVFPNASISSNVYEVSLNPATPRRSRGNLRSRIRLPGPLGGDPQQLVETFEYDTTFGGCCGFNFVTKQTDARSNVTFHAYDERGNRTNTIHREPTTTEAWEYNSYGQLTGHTLPDNGTGHRRRDEFTYYASGPERGYRYQEIVDASGLALTTKYEYDAVGNPVRIIDRRGHDWLYTYNQLNQRVSERSAEVTPGSGVRFKTDRFYDANNNVIRLDIPNTGDLLTPTGNTNLTTTYDYDILNRRVSVAREVDESHNVVTQYGYDANGNLAVVRSGEATSGRQPANIVEYQYDERDRPFRKIRAGGTVGQSSEQYDYDANGNLKCLTRGLEGFGGTNGVPHTNRFVYDGYNRLIRSTNAMGNVRLQQHDANGNVIVTRVEGELTDLPGSTGNVRLSETTYSYDAMDRVTNRTSAFFDLLTQSPLGGDGQVNRHFTYNANSQITQVTDDAGYTTRTDYDWVNRPQLHTDAKGNTVSNIYDNHDNLIAVSESHRSDLGNSNQYFLTQYTYDNLDRRMMTIDSAGNTNRYFYDSRDNITRTLDALGNEKWFEYDGLARPVRVVRYLTTNGVGGGPIIGTVVTQQRWDDSSRLVAQTDGSSNTTSYVYDALDRIIRTTHADNTTNYTWYDVHGNTIATRDANRSVVYFSYDLLERCTNKAITPGLGVAADTTFERFAYDGSSHLIRAQNDSALVTRSYDSLSHPTSETLNGKTITRTWDSVGNKTSITYPGGRSLLLLYDGLHQVREIKDPYLPSISYDYIGPGRVERRVAGGAARSAYEYDGITGIANPVGDHGERRLAKIIHSRISDGAVLDAHGFAYDPEQNRISRNDLRINSPVWVHRFGYDSLYRLQQTTVTNAIGSLLRDTSYAYDNADNRLGVTGTLDPGGYTLDSTLPEPGDRQMNQYSATPFDSRDYDQSGNLTRLTMPAANKRGIAYDYRNQMVRYTNINASAIHFYAYDPLGRRIWRSIKDEAEIVTARYLYDGWQMIEEQGDTGTTMATYVYGRGPNDAVSMRRGTTNSWFLADDIGNVLAITDNTGLVVERYEYLDYGTPLFFDGNNNPLGQSAVGNRILFGGHRYDPETGLYYCRARYLDPRAGRFITRDPLGTWGDGVGRGNAYNYTGNNPHTWVDPSGTKMDDPHTAMTSSPLDAYNGPNEADSGRGGGGGASAPYGGASVVSASGDCYGRLLNLEFSDTCSSSQRATLRGNACLASWAAAQSSVDVGILVAYDAQQADPNYSVANPYPAGPSLGVQMTRARLVKWFGGPDGKTSYNSKEIIHNTLNSISVAFRNEEIGFKCKKHAEGKRIARINWYPYGLGTFVGDIKVYPMYWNFGAAEQASIVAHEMSHAYGGTEDQADFYYTGPDYKPEEAGSHETRWLRKQADTYRMFLLDFYTTSTPGSGPAYQQNNNPAY